MRGIVENRWFNGNAGERGLRALFGAFVLAASAILIVACTLSSSAYAAQPELTSGSLSEVRVTAAAPKAAKSSYALLAKNGRVYPCDSKGALKAKAWQSSSSVKKLFVAANVTNVPKEIKYTHKHASSGAISNPVKFNLKSVTFLLKGGKNACKTIAAKAFRGSSQLKAVNNLQYTKLTTIGDYAFAQTGLTSLKLPSTVSKIGEYAFYKDASLEKVSGMGKTGLKNVGNQAFRGCSSLGALTLPDTCIAVGDYAFYECSSLAKVHVGANTQSVGAYAFAGCTALESISLPATTSTLLNGAFYGCSSLSSATLLSDSVVARESEASSMNTVFGKTPLYEGEGAIYVPEALLAQYTADTTTNKWWKYRSRFVAVESLAAVESAEPPAEPPAEPLMEG